MNSKIPLLKNKNKRTVDNVIVGISNRNRANSSWYNLKQTKSNQETLTIEQLKNKLNKN